MTTAHSQMTKPDSLASAYTLESNGREQRRLRTQAESLREHTMALLEPIEVAPKARAVDLGCGPGGAIEILSELVGAHGHVVGVELDETSVGSARTLIRKCGLGNVEIVRADARDTGLPSSSFDLVHVRLLLVNLAAPEEVVAEMARLVRPGGYVAVLEPDVGLGVCYPPDPSLARLTELLTIAYRLSGADLYLGRRLPQLLANAGLEKIAVQARAEVCPSGHPQRTVCVDLVQNMRSKILHWGLIDERELDQLDHAARGHLDDPYTMSLPVTYFAACARKPVWAA
jgi:SAM-dependent methyltransferase